MSYSYDLTVESWIPVVDGAGQTREVSLTEALVRAPQVREIVDGSPLVTAALHRLLLAILHRVFGPPGRRGWVALWEAGRWEEEPLLGYLEQWRERFDLFHPQRPFYQTVGMPEKMLGPVARLAQELAWGNNDTLFDHRLDGEPQALAPGRAARLVLARQAFSLGGLIAAEDGRSSAKAAPLASVAVILCQGENLFETLMLNLVAYDPHTGRPWPVRGQQDLPTWEQMEPVCAEERPPQGYLDYLTWQSRRIWLKPEPTPSGAGLCVRRAILGDGRRFPKQSSLYGLEQMAVFQVRRRAKPQDDPRPALRLAQSRAFWRDSVALFRRQAEESSRPRTLEWLADLTDQGLEREQVYALAALGMCSDRAKVHFWRHERLPLPLALLRDDEVVADLGGALQLAEGTGGCLQAALGTLAGTILKPGDPKQADRDRVRQLRESWGEPGGYWAALEEGFPELLLRLAGNADSRDGALIEWAGLARRAAQEALERVRRGLPGDARFLRAGVAAARHLHYGLRKHHDRYREVNDDQSS